MFGEDPLKGHSIRGGWIPFLVGKMFAMEKGFGSAYEFERQAMS